jgi:hypothetical protein
MIGYHGLIGLPKASQVATSDFAPSDQQTAAYDRERNAIAYARTYHPGAGTKAEKQSTSMVYFCNGDPGRIRTSDLQLRRRQEYSENQCGLLHFLPADKW